MPQAIIKDHALEYVEADQAMALEDSLWWMVGRQAVLRQYLNQALRRTPLRRIMEVGCGSGGNFPLLAEYGTVFGCERSQILADRARSRCIAEEVYAADFFDLAGPYSFDLTCLFDVLEHIESDGEFLQRLGTHVRPGHQLLISVPACQFLYSKHDELLHHYRRYSRPGLANLLETNGFTVHRCRYFLFSVFPLVALSRVKEKVLAWLGHEQTDVNVGAVPQWLNWLLLQTVRLEALIARAVPAPVGVWALALAEKR